MTALLIAALLAILPPNENKVVAIVSREYNLTEEQTALLCAIRRSENGVPPFYYGVADKRCNTYVKQCRWTANTIRKRYDGDLPKFAARWCPTNTKVWMKNVIFFMRSQGVKK